MDLQVSALADRSVAVGPVEIVERKGLGHPDTICDALAEAFSRALSREYLDRCGMIVHHNVDKVLLRGGASSPELGGGRIVEPIDLSLIGARFVQPVRRAEITDPAVVVDHLIEGETDRTHLIRKQNFSAERN